MISLILRRIAAALLFLIGYSVIRGRVRRHGGSSHEDAPHGGITMSNARLYDIASRLLWARMFKGVAADVDSLLTAGGKVLDVGCGPGYLSIELARLPGVEVSAIDLDPNMIERAIANADRALPPGERPSFTSADVAALPFDDDTFDAVASTLSMHHWGDREAGLAEIRRVLKPGAAALMWDWKPGSSLHPKMADDAAIGTQAGLELVNAAPWRWPGPFSLCYRFEFRKAS